MLLGLTFDTLNPQSSILNRQACRVFLRHDTLSFPSADPWRSKRHRLSGPFLRTRRRTGKGLDASWKASKESGHNGY